MHSKILTFAVCAFAIPASVSARLSPYELAARNIEVSQASHPISVRRRNQRAQLEQVAQLSCAGQVAAPAEKGNAAAAEKEKAAAQVGQEAAAAEKEKAAAAEKEKAAVAEQEKAAAAEKEKAAAAEKEKAAAGKEKEAAAGGEAAAGEEEKKESKSRSSIQVSAIL